MNDEEFFVKQGLRETYYNLRMGLQSIENLYKNAKKQGWDVSRQLVKEWLKHRTCTGRTKNYTEI